MKDKPAKFRLKEFSANGYVLDITVYTGKEKKAYLNLFS